MFSSRRILLLFSVSFFSHLFSQFLYANLFLTKESVGNSSFCIEMITICVLTTRPPGYPRFILLFILQIMLLFASVFTEPSCGLTESPLCRQGRKSSSRLQLGPYMSNTIKVRGQRPAVTVCSHIETLLLQSTFCHEI